MSLNNLARKREKRLRMQRLLANNMGKSLFSLSLYFLSMIALHIFAMVYFEKLPLGDATWITLTTVTTVGYGDLSAQTTEGRFATVLLLYFGGIFILAKIAGDYFEFRGERRNLMLKGQWRWKMQDHIVVINTPSNNIEQYFGLLVSQFRQIPEFQDLPIQILTNKYPSGLPESLLKHDVVHYTGEPEDGESLRALNLTQAKHVVILARDEHDMLSDSLTFDILHRLRDIDTDATVLVECVNDQNRERFYQAGASAVVRPIRAYPELIVRAVAAPGSEKVLENLFTHGGNHTQRYNVSIDNVKWSEVVCALINQGLGTALAYMDRNGEIVTDPAPSDLIHARELIVLVREQHIPNKIDIHRALAAG
jgi:voltage-gated potassium channel